VIHETPGKLALRGVLSTPNKAVVRSGLTRAFRIFASSGLPRRDTPWLDDPESVLAEIERFLAIQPPSAVEAVA
jgi:hypothetical protein